MDWKVINKRDTGSKVSPNLADYTSAVEAFSWEAMEQKLDGSPEGGGSISPSRPSAGMARGLIGTASRCAS